MDKVIQSNLRFFVEKLLECKTVVELLGAIETFKLTIYMEATEAYNKKHTKEQ